MKKLAIAVGIFASTTASANPGIDALDARIETTAAQRFAKLFHATNGKPTAAQLQSDYLDNGGRGVEIFTPYRIENAQNLAAAIAAQPDRYRYAIDTCLPLVEGLNGEMRSIYLAYSGLLPEKPLPAVHVLFGAGNSGGTAFADAQVLGLEVMCGPGTTKEQFIRNMRGMFAHETVHTWQKAPEPEAYKDLLLFAALREGVADYLAWQVTGDIPNPERDIWARQREGWLWREFSKDRDFITKGLVKPGEPDEAGNKASLRWIGNYGSAPEGWPVEAGYWVGMRICEAYVAQAADKRQAMRELIELKDPVAILAASGYDPR